MSEITIGKNVLESLTFGMYQDPKIIFREYIQNATDSIDHAINLGVVSRETAEIHITIDESARKISIKDNGTGICAEKAQKILSDVGNSSKDYRVDGGFRGMGRLAGLAYCERLFFITKDANESVETIMSWDCVRMRELLSPSNNEIADIVGVIRAISNVDHRSVNDNSHYFEVVMENVRVGPKYDELVDENLIKQYLSIVAPVDFDAQKFRQAPKIARFFEEKGQVLPTYKIFFGVRRMPITKLYTQRLDTSVGVKKKKENEYIKDLDLLYKENEEGKPLYIGWLAITDFSGQIKDKNLRGIRLRKKNILVGDEKTFDSYFPSEGDAANKMFAGEIHVINENVIPNSQRDNFEPSKDYSEMFVLLSEWAGEINRSYRRGTSIATSAIRKLEEAIGQQRELEKRIDSGAISSEQKKEEMSKELERMQKQIKKEKATLSKAVENGTLEETKQEKAKDLLEKANAAEKEAATISTKIVQAQYATKGDLPSSYGREERKLYQRIIATIDTFFAKDHETAEKLRSAIISELSVKKK